MDTAWSDRRLLTCCIPNYGECRYALSNTRFIASQALHDDVFYQMLINGRMYANNDGDEFCMFWSTAFLQQAECLGSKVIRALHKQRFWKGLTVVWMSFGIVVFTTWRAGRSVRYASRSAAISAICRRLSLFPIFNNGKCQLLSRDPPCIGADESNTFRMEAIHLRKSSRSHSIVNCRPAALSFFTRVCKR
jgi:hypothetical protein